jgi:hypothetical protein
MQFYNFDDARAETQSAAAHSGRSTRLIAPPCYTAGWGCNIYIDGALGVQGVSKRGCNFRLQASYAQADHQDLSTAMLCSALW